VQNTHSPVDVDLLNDITRLPERQRLTIILNELGAGLAGRGSDLNAVIKRANPALRELDKVLAILASENHVLAKLAVDSDKALAPFAAVRGRRRLHRAEQHRRAGQRPPPRRARTQPQAVPGLPAPARPGDGTPRRFADQTTPVFTNLGIAAPGINQAFTHLPAFSKSSDEPSSRASAKPRKVSGPALVAIEAAAQTPELLGSAAKPFAGNFSELLSSLRSTRRPRAHHGLHLPRRRLRQRLRRARPLPAHRGLGTICLKYQLTPAPGCSANLNSTTGSTAATASAVSNPSTTSLVMDRTLAVLKGDTPAEALAAYPGSAPAAGALSGAGSPGGSSASAQPVGGASAGTTYYTPAAEAGAGGMLLNYLLGN
jgi:phospholipid/cholesterol/gamma-HCH transport system substrate-binding protein